MPRGKRPSPRKVTQSEMISAFAGRVEQAAPAWLDEFMERQRVLLERFHEKDDEGNYVCSPSEMSRIHQTITASTSDMMRFAALREQHMKAKGLSAYAERDGTQNHLTINYAALRWL